MSRTAVSRTGNTTNWGPVTQTGVGKTQEWAPMSRSGVDMESQRPSVYDEIVYEEEEEDGFCGSICMWIIIALLAIGIAVGLFFILKKKTPATVIEEPDKTKLGKWHKWSCGEAKASEETRYDDYPEMVQWYLDYCLATSDRLKFYYDIGADYVFELDTHDGKQYALQFEGGQHGTFDPTNPKNVKQQYARDNEKTNYRVMKQEQQNKGQESVRPSVGLPSKWYPNNRWAIQHKGETPAFPSILSDWIEANYIRNFEATGKIQKHTVPKIACELGFNNCYIVEFRSKAEIVMYPIRSDKKGHVFKDFSGKRITQMRPGLKGRYEADTSANKTIKLVRQMGKKAPIKGDECKELFDGNAMLRIVDPSKI